MGKVKKSVKKFLEKGGAEAPKKANLKRKNENQLRQKIKKKLIGQSETVDDNMSSKKDKVSKKTSSGGANSASAIKALEEMDVSAFMTGMGSSDESEDEAEKVEESDEEESKEGNDEDEKDENSDAGDDDEDEEEDEEGGGMADSLSYHKKELEELASKDPEFFKYLQENNQDLLEFEGSDEDDEDGEISEEEEEEDGEEEEIQLKKSETVKPAVVVNLSQLKTLMSSLKKEHSMRGLKKLLDMYRSGCSAGSENALNSGSSKYDIPSASVYNHLMVTALQTLHGEFSHHFTCHMKASTESSECMSDRGLKNLTKSGQWTRMEPLLITFFKATLSLLRSVTDMSLAGFILKQLKHYTDFLVPFPKLVKRYLKLFLDLWGESQEPDVDSRAVQVASFFRIRQFAITMPFPLIEDCLKGLYLTYVRNARFTNEQSIPVLTFMGNCIVELFGLDMKSSFSHGFVYIRQLAMVLRNAMVKKSKDSLSSVFNWQFLNSLRVWSAIVTQYPKTNELSDLTFPLVQVLMGVEKLGHSPRLLPFRLHCARLLNQLAASGGIFVPVAPLILEVLTSTELHKKPVPSTDLPPKFDSVIKLPEQLSAHQQDAVFNASIELLHTHLDIYSFSPGFPEFSAPIRTSLSAFAKSTKIARWRTVVKGEMDFINRQSLWVTQKRSLLTSGPGGGGIESLLPTDKANAYKRLDSAVQLKTKAEQEALRNELMYLKRKPKRANPNKQAPSTETNGQDIDSETETDTQKNRKKQTKPVKKQKVSSSSNVDDLQDVVEEGFDWDDEYEE